MKIKVFAKDKYSRLLVAICDQVKVDKDTLKLYVYGVGMVCELIDVKNSVWIKDKLEFDITCDIIINHSVSHDIF